jgi:hypothetical protein
MEAALNAKAEVGVATQIGIPHQISAPETEAERRAVDCFKALKAAEESCDEGFEFGRAIIALRDEIKASRKRDWMERLEQLGVTYEKARYWMAKVEEKPTQRGGTKAKKKPNAPELSDWEAKLDELWRAVEQIHHLDPDKRDDVELKKVAADLADLLGCELAEKGTNEARLLQREQQARGGDAAAADEKRADSGGGGR